jgi:hypothetical protein
MYEWSLHPQTISRSQPNSFVGRFHKSGPAVGVSGVIVAVHAQPDDGRALGIL